MAKSKKNNIIAIDDGTREYLMTDVFGRKICAIHFCPTDPNIRQRAEAFSGEMSSLYERIQGKQIDEKEAAGVLKSAINTLLDSEDADRLFERRSPFTTFNGTFYFAVVADWILATVKNAIDESVEEAESRMSKYLDDIDEAVTADEARAASKGA